MDKTLADAVCWVCKNWKWSEEHVTECKSFKVDFGESVEIWFPPNGDMTWSIKPTLFNIKLPTESSHSNE